MKLNESLFGRRQKIEAERTHITVSTAAPMERCQVVDCISAMSSQKAGAAGVELDAIFEHVKNKLRTKCEELGGDAVVSCRFDQRGAHSGGLVPSQVIEIWAYGTVIRRVDDVSND